MERPGGAGQPGGEIAEGLAPPPLRAGRRGRATRRLDPTAPCLNCGDPTPGEYCPTCGQRKVGVQISIRAMVAEALEDELTVDRRLPTTLAALLFRPGMLTVEYVNGRIARYIRPFRLYLVSSVIFFLLLSFTSLRFIREVPMGPTGPPATAVSDTLDPAALDTLDAAEIDTDLAAVRAALETPGLPAAARDSLRARRNHLIRVQAALAVRDRDGEAGDEVPPDRPAGDAPITGDTPLAFLADIQPRLGHPTLNAAAQARLRELSRMELRQAVERIVSQFMGYIPTLMFILLPLFAGFLKLLYIRQRRFYAEHVIFLLHTHAFIYVLYTVLLLIVVAGWFRGWLMSAMLLWMLAYTYLAMHRVYGQGWLKTLVKLGILGWSYFFVLLFTAPIAFLVTVLLL
jgi:hypothetical protein